MLLSLSICSFVNRSIQTAYGLMSYKYSSPRVGTLPLPVGSPWVEDFSWLLSVWLVHLPHNESQSQMDSLNMLIKARRRHCACTCAHSCAHTRGRLIGSWIAPLGRGPDCSSLIFEVTNSLSPSAASLSHSQTHTHTRALALHTHIHPNMHASSDFIFQIRHRWYMHTLMHH